MLVSIGVSGRLKFHHASQYATQFDRSTWYVEVRPKSQLFLILGNDKPKSVEFFLSPDNLSVETNSLKMSLPPKTQLALPISVNNFSAYASIDVSTENIFPIKFVLISYQEIQRRRLIHRIKAHYPNPFPADQISVNDPLSNFIEKQFHGLSSVALSDIQSLPKRISPPSLRGPNSTEKAGFVYLLVHPLYEEWIKIGSTVDLARRVSTYQTSDPLRRYRLKDYYEVDDRMAIEKWVIHNLSSKHDVAGEWINCGVEEAVQDVRNAIELIGINPNKGV